MFDDGAKLLEMIKNMKAFLIKSKYSEKASEKEITNGVGAADIMLLYAMAKYEEEMEHD